MCSAEIGSSHKFCSACGTAVDAEGSVERLPSERKIVSVLFADIVASTELIEGLDPDEAADAIEPILEAMKEGVHRYSGVITKVAGDGIMALFGAPVADEHHAIGACFAAIDIPRLVRADHPDVEVRVGVHSGEVLVHPEANDFSAEYVASGPTVHLAARMEQLAQPGIPLVTASTAGLAGGNVRLGASDEIEVDGFEGLIEVYELMGKADASGSIQSRMARRLSPFIARRDELAELGHAWEAVESGTGEVVAIAGGPGIGKSRLAYEFVSSLEQTAVILSSQASPYDRATPYRPLAEMMRSWLGRRGGGELNVVEVLEVLDPSLTVYADALTALIGGEPSSAWLAVDAGLRRQTTRRAARAIIGAAALEQNLVLVFEDLHWMDGESLSVIDELVDLTETTPLLVLVTMRPEVEERWTDRDGVTLIALEGLMGTDVTEFVNGQVGTKSSTSAIRAELSERSDGTPLFIEELVRALADQGVLAGEHGKYKRGENDLRVDMPAEVQTVIASRIDRLPPIAKELLQLMAVHGEQVRWDLLEATTDRTERERDDGMAILVESAMVNIDDLTGPPTYAFKHNLIREVAYTTIPTKRREALHARIAEGVIALEFEEDWTERLAHHTFEAGQWDDAARFALASAKRAAAKSAYTESEQFLSMSLEALALLPKSKSNIEQTIDALITRRISTVGVGGRISQGFGSLDDAESLANEIGDLERVARVNLHRSYARSMTGQQKQGIIDADRAFGIGQQLGSRRITAESNLAKAQNHAFAANPLPVGPLLARDLTFFAEQVGRNGMMGYRIVHALAQLTVAHAWMGHFDAGRQSARDGIGHAKEHGLTVDVITSQWSLALLEMNAENHKRAVELSAEACDLAAAHDFAWTGSALDIVRGYCLARLGGFDEGVVIIERALDRARDYEAPMQIAFAHCYLSELMTSTGQNEVARRNAREALNTARKHEIRAAEVMALQMLGRAQHLLRESQGFFEEALALSVEHGLRPLTALIQMELSWTVGELGDTAAAEELLRSANALRSEMGLSEF